MTHCSNHSLASLQAYWSRREKKKRQMFFCCVQYEANHSLSNFSYHTWQTMKGLPHSLSRSFVRISSPISITTTTTRQSDSLSDDDGRWNHQLSLRHVLWGVRMKREREKCTWIRRATAPVISYLEKKTKCKAKVSSGKNEAVAR